MIMLIRLQGAVCTRGTGNRDTNLHAYRRPRIIGLLGCKYILAPRRSYESVQTDRRVDTEDYRLEHLLHVPFKTSEGMCTAAGYMTSFLCLVSGAFDRSTEGDGEGKM